jgi:carbonic anhydrase
MSSEKPAAPASTPAARRLPLGKLALAGGGAVTTVALLVGALVWVWPSGPDPAAAKKASRERRVAAQAAAASAAAASAAAAAQVAEVAEVAGPAAFAADTLPAPASGAAASAAEAAPAMAIRSDPAPQDASEPASLSARSSETSADAELALDRLQRRLGEVLGPRGAVDTGRSGEWRVLARTSTAPTASADPVRRSGLPEQVAPRGQPAAGSVADAVYAGPWTYSGPGGPQAWGRLKPEYAACAKGQRQSPIDIRDGLAVDLEPVRFDYRPGSVAIVDTGYTVQVNVAPGNAIELNGQRYELQQFHFHRPSEQRIDGRRYDMDLQLVHKDAEGRLAVVVVLLERGSALPLLQSLWGQIPLEKGEEQPLRTPVDPSQLLPEDRRYFTFMGSLTTPPCTEGVLWVVMRQPVPISAAQIDVFAHLYPMNARPVQRTAGRLIKQSN